MKIVIAKYKEDLSWTKQLPPEIEVCVVDKGPGGDLENNVGREANSYAWYILQNWDNLEGEYVFSQGRYDDQAPELVEKILEKRYFGLDYICDWLGYPNYPELDLRTWCLALGIEPRGHYLFKCGAFFKLSADEIKEKGDLWWQKVFDLTCVYPESSHALERLWPYIFPRLQKDLEWTNFKHCRMM